ncbi:MAG: PqqD family protein [Bacteroidales bacterium]|nr:PqqD family protein [Bacteroidales bacterium]HPD96282.1 PqqD family protein [Tenuifilaceae bacterium]HRX30631.1 PqqD family protein [Tenuifilaceae bacterium]
MKVKENIAISDNGFVFNPTTGDSFTLNNTGKEILLLIKGGKSMGEIKTTLLSSYDMDETTLDRYLLDFVSELRFNNLIDE